MFSEIGYGLANKLGRKGVGLGLNAGLGPACLGPSIFISSLNFHFSRFLRKAARNDVVLEI